MKIFCVITENFLLTFVVFFSISSKLLLAGFCRNLPATRGNAAQIRPQAFTKAYLIWITNFQRFPSVFLYILYYFTKFFLYICQLTYCRHLGSVLGLANPPKSSWLDLLFISKLFNQFFIFWLILLR